MTQKSYRKYIEFVALCLLATALLWWFGRNLDWWEVGHRVSSANPFLLIIAVAIICLAYLVRAFRWRALLTPLVPARLSDLFVATTIGFSAVFLIGRAGEVVRPVVLPMRDPRVRPSASLVTIFVERIYDMMAVALMFAFNLIWFQPVVTNEISFGRVRIAGFAMLVATILGLIFLVWYRTKSAWLIDILERRVTRWRFVPQRLTKLVLRLLEQLSQALRVLVNARELAVTIGWTVLVWLGIALANFLVMRAFGLRVGVSETLFVLGWSLVGSLVPTPGGAAGAFHAATAAGFLFLGVEKDLAAAVAIVLHLVDFGPAVLFGVFYAIRGDLSISRLRTLVSPKQDFENPVGEVQ
ncbi:MAG TPA: lysylphosphatidylglycerol synthase transmembrane domain-containing protein [Pyrinomonadaceae bacterium]|nr:lysylphosphatidylglycerol synthase transmembrane domain-containing protein [Pyrinomonadaceae bacterium]